MRDVVASIIGVLIDWFIVTALIFVITFALSGCASIEGDGFRAGRVYCKSAPRVEDGVEVWRCEPPGGAKVQIRPAAAPAWKK